MTYSTAVSARIPWTAGQVPTPVVGANCLSPVPRPPTSRGRSWVVTYHPWQTMKVGDKSEDVEHLQRLLAGANRVGYDADPGPITGAFTEETGAAVQRMKYHLGYPTRDISPLGGQRL